MKAFGFIDRVCYINLLRRPDRRAQIENHLYELGILSGVVREEAVHPLDLVSEKTGKTFTDEQYSAFKDSDLSTHCAWVSHQKAVKKAKDAGLSNILIFEDDAYFCRLDAPEIIADAGQQLKSIPNWEVLYLGGLPIIKDDRYYEQVSPSLIKIGDRQVNGAHAVLYNNTTFDRFEHDSKNPNMPITPSDNYVSFSFKEKYMIYPLCAIQRKSLSSISGDTLGWSIREWNFECKKLTDRTVRRF